MTLPIGNKKPFVDIVTHREPNQTTEKTGSPAPAKVPAADIFETAKPQKTLESAMSPGSIKIGQPGPSSAQGKALPAEDIQLKALLKKA